MRSFSTIWTLLILAVTAVLLLLNLDTTLGPEAARMNIFGQSVPQTGLFVGLGLAGIVLLWIASTLSGALGKRRIAQLEKEIVALKAAAYDKGKSTPSPSSRSVSVDPMETRGDLQP